MTTFMTLYIDMPFFLWYNKSYKKGGTFEMYSVLSKFLNVGSEWTVLCLKGDFAFLYSRDLHCTPYVVAWKLCEDGSWCQGHYFTNFEDAFKFFDGLED